MTMNTLRPSIHDLPISTATGGTPARIGFTLQDHVAATYCIRMLLESSIKAVWSEAHDDITLIWQVSDGEEVEFIQVKGSDFDQMWSIALLCNRDSILKNNKKEKKAGTSILERSLARHACSEPCRFRLVTALPEMAELRPLTLPLESKDRIQEKAKLDGLAAEIAKRIEPFRSPNGGDAAFWVKQTVLEVIHSIEAVRAKNLVAFDKALEKLGHLLLNDQREEVYQKLIAKISAAGTASVSEEKKISRDQLLAWLAETVASLARPGLIGGQKMEEKMEIAGLASEAILAANEARNHYRMQYLEDRYSAPLTVKQIELEIVARLNMLRARLDVGEYPDDGPMFHKLCLDNLGELYATRPEASQLGLAFLQGCMYSITDRCGHRFRKVRP